MKPERSELELEGWAFALAIYARPGIAEACLRLQNDADVDVMLLLMAAFAAVKRRILLTPHEIKALDDACGPWREQIVQRLRAIRTELKAGPQPAPSAATEPFRSKIKAIELEAEKLENHLLAAHLPLNSPRQQMAGPEQLRAVLSDVARHFADKRGIELDTGLTSSINAIAEAAIQETG